MKIAFLNYFQDVNKRGGEVFINEIGQSLSETHSIRIFSAGPVLSQNRTLSLFQRLYLDLASLRIGLWTLAILPKLSKYNPQIILPLNNGWQTVILRLYTWLTNKKLVISAQSGPGWDDRINLAFSPDIFVCLTQTQAHWAKSVFHWPWQKFATIPNGVDLKQFSPDGQKAHLNLQKPIILLVAAADQQKRVSQTIKAVSKLKEVSLLWLGTGPDLEKLVSLGNKLLGSKRFLNLTLPHSQLPQYYRSADIFTLCSKSSEAFGIVYLEALASGLPVVATDDPSRREIVGKAGLFVKNPGNATEYANSLRQALKTSWDNLPRQQSLQYSWQKITQQYLHVLNSLVE